MTVNSLFPNITFLSLELFIHRIKLKHKIKPSTVGSVEFCLQYYILDTDILLCPVNTCTTPHLHTTTFDSVHTCTCEQIKAGMDGQTANEKHDTLLESVTE